MNKHFSLYIHVPFCVSKCKYCDFVSFVSGEDTKRDYFRALESEIDHTLYAGYRTVDTIFIGGGTPSSVDAGYIERILNAVRRKFSLSEHCEITIESNPGTLSVEKCRKYRELGINRISIGVQAVQPHLLKLLGRTHTTEDVARSVEYIRSAGFENMNLDLMFGLPSQSVAEWKQTLDFALQCNPEHLSVYSLIVEEGTPFWETYGNCDFITDETDRLMYHHAYNQLKGCGYEQYEISNFTKPGFACRHNLFCWGMEEYLGFGLNASSFVDRKRFTNFSDMKKYLEGTPECASQAHRLDERELESDYLMLGFRKTDGIDLIEFKEIFHENFMNRYHTVTENLMSKGLLQLKYDHLSLSKKGLDYANCVMREFI